MLVLKCNECGNMSVRVRLEDGQVLRARCGGCGRELLHAEYQSLSTTPDARFVIGSTAGG